MKTTNDLPKGLKTLTVEDEQAEILLALNKGQKMPTLRLEKPQKNYKAFGDKIVHVGWLDMYTVVSDFYDTLGRNRKGSTFGLEGLTELGIDPKNCEVLK